nr:MFS transporter [uncultured Actinoplanes sp.]
MKIIDQARALPRVTKILLATNAVNSFGGGLVFAFLWIYLQDVRDLPVWVPATTMAIQALTAMGGGLLWGTVLDRWSYRTVVGAVMTLAGLGTALYAVVTGPVTAVVAAIVYGFGLSGVGTALRTMYASSTSPEHRGVAFELDFGIFNAMTGVGVLVGGAVVSAGFLDRADRFALLYLADGVTFLITGLVAGLLLHGRKEPAGAGDAAGKPSYLTLLRDRRLFLLYAIMAALMLVSFGQFRSGLPAYLTGTGAVTAGGLSFTFALDIAVIMVVQFLVMPRLRHVPRSTLLAASGALLAASWVGVLIAGQFRHTAALLIAALAIVLMAIAEVFVYPVVSTLVNNLAPDHLRGRANALLSLTLSSSSVLGPILAGALIGWHGGIILVSVLIALSLLAIVLVAPLRSRMPEGSDAETGEDEDAPPAKPDADDVEATVG